MDAMQVVRVFVNEKGEYGNPHGIVFDENHKLNDSARQSIARESGFSETVFINDRKVGDISIFNPLEDCPFAGSALLATASLLQPLDCLISNGVKIPTWQEGAATYIRMNKSVLPNWNYEQLSTPAEVEKLTLVDTNNKQHTFVWAWIDENKGLVRARTFASDWGIPEDEANGSGSMKLSLTLARDITVIHGLGSIIHARPASNGSVEVGGLIALS